MSLSVSEIFYSIQGEGPNIGRPSVFLRLAGCNLKCNFCDTKYSWSNSEFESISNKKIIQRIGKFGCKNLVITGGEPLLQQNEIKTLLDELKEYKIEIETNGSIRLKIAKNIEQINCSPKLSNSGNLTYSLSILPNNKKVIYKFVVRKKSDISEIQNFCKKYKIPKTKIWLMPEGTDRNTIIRRSVWLSEICKKEGYNFSPRLHIMLWGNKRGK